MPTTRLLIDGEPAWEMDHFLPPLWLWLFDVARVTESRRLHETTFSAAERFSGLRESAARSPFFAELTAPFEELQPDKWPRDLASNPDAIVRLDLDELERTRPFKLESQAAKMDAFLVGCAAGDRRALVLWEDAIMSPLGFSGGVQRDGIMLGRLAEEFGLPREDRAVALVWHLFGRPLSRPAKALSHQWTERARDIPMAHFTPRISFWRRFLP